MFLVFFSLTLLMIALLALSIWLYFKYKTGKRLKTRATQETQGSVVGYVLEDNIFVPKLSYYVDGKEYFQHLRYKRILSSVSGFSNQKEGIKGDPLAENVTVYNRNTSPQFPLGMTLPVFYNPNDPQASYVARYVNKSGYFLIFSIQFAVLSFLLLVGQIILLFVLLNHFAHLSF